MVQAQAEIPSESRLKRHITSTRWKAHAAFAFRAFGALRESLQKGTRPHMEDFVSPSPSVLRFAESVTANFEKGVCEIGMDSVCRLSPAVLGEVPAVPSMPPPYSKYFVLGVARKEDGKVAMVALSHKRVMVFGPGYWSGSSQYDETTDFGALFKHSLTRLSYI